MFGVLVAKSETQTICGKRSNNSTHCVPNVTRIAAASMLCVVNCSKSYCFRYEFLSVARANGCNKCDCTDAGGGCKCMDQGHYHVKNSSAAGQLQRRTHEPRHPLRKSRDRSSDCIVSYSHR